MDLRVLLPFRVFCHEKGVKRIVAESIEGSFGILPHRLDCVACLAPGILFYETERAGEKYIALDQGLLVKSGFNIYISARNAIAEMNLSGLRLAVDSEFRRFTQQDINLRTALAKLETELVKRLVDFEFG